MPVNEVASTNSWGYDPAYFYAVEAAYGGPDALKRLVDSCHRHGLAVHVDLVFNHAGSTDNILWATAQGTFFDGDTRWGAMVNFDHPVCRHFFEQNVVYLRREFHIDGFRFDHTHTIVHSHLQTGFVTQPGSGGGWDFLAGLRRALHAAGGGRCLLSAEHLPNEWNVTNYPGPMDSQWGDDFHDRLLDTCRGAPVGPLARAMRLSHDASDDWYKVVNYAESHDEVGNVPDRIANVAGWGRGLRMSKLAAAASILCRGVPMFFMGAEVGEHRQFRFGSTDTLDLNAYTASPTCMRVRAWWDACCRLRRSDRVKGPAPLAVHLVDGHLLAFSRGDAADLFVVLNFGDWAGHRPLWQLNLPAGTYRELWNSTWPAFAVEGEDEHGNGGREARLRPDHDLHVPDYGVVVLERV